MAYSADKKFFNSDSPIVFYVAGFLAADGCVHQKRKKKIKDGAQYLTLTLAEKDYHHLQKIKELLKWTGPTNRKISKAPLSWGRGKDSIQYFFQIGSIEMCKSLIRFGIGERKSLTYKMPDWLCSHPLINYFLLGYFDGDGCISFNKDKKKLQIHIAGTKSFLKQFNNILIKQNLSSKNKKLYLNNKIHVLSFNGIIKCLSIYKFLYGSGEICMDRKFQIYKDAYIIRNNFVSVLLESKY